MIVNFICQLDIISITWKTVLMSDCQAQVCLRACLWGMVLILFMNVGLEVGSIFPWLWVLDCTQESVELSTSPCELLSALDCGGDKLLLTPALHSLQ